MCAVALVAAAAGVGLAVAAPSVFASGADVGLAIAVAVLGSALQLPLRIFSHLLYGLERIVERNAFTVARLVLSLAATIAGVLAGWALPAYLALALGAEVLLAGAQALWAMRGPAGVTLRPRLVKRATVGELTRFGIPTFGLQAATQIVYYSDAVVVGASLGTARAGVYAVAMRLVEGASVVLGQIADVFMPVLARLHAGERAPDARRLALLGAYALLVVASPIIAVLIGFGGPLIDLWVGHGYEDAALPLALLAGALLFSAPLRFPVLWALGAARHGRVAFLALAEALSNVALSVALVSPLGLRGVALASLVTIAVSNGYLIPRVLGAELGAPFGGWYVRPVLGVAAIIALPAVPCALLVEPGTSAGLTIAGSVGLGAAVLGAVLVTTRRPR
jgi:O-antigen/teichoic acid export membrane protein